MTHCSCKHQNKRQAFALQAVRAVLARKQPRCLLHRFNSPGGPGAVYRAIRVLGERR